MFQATFAILKETVRQARDVYTERMKFHCRKLAFHTSNICDYCMYDAIRTNQKRARIARGTFKGCAKFKHALRAVREAYKRKNG